MKWILVMEGCVEPVLYGPYDTEEERLFAVRQLNADDPNKENSFCRIDGDDVKASSFINYEVEEE